MASHVFYRKWRPRTLAEVVGQPAITQTLLNALGTGRISHAYLFCGPRGTGKTSTARILAKAVNCLDGGKGEPCNSCAMCQSITEGRALDVIEIDAASNTGVEDIRSLREKVAYAPNQARYKVYIIDEVHMLSNSAANALLKTLEEPPPHVIFVLATTEAHKLLPTIMSRCQRLDFRRLSQADVIAKLDQVCRAENITIDAEALRLIARSATGSLRDAENLLEQLTTYYGADIGLAQVQALLGITGDARARELVKHIVINDIAAGMTTISSVSADGLDLKQFNRELVDYLRALLLVKTGSGQVSDLTSEDIAELKTLAARASLEQVLLAVKLFGQLDFRLDSYSTLPLELALVDCALGSGGKKPASPVKEAPQSSRPAASSPVKPAPPRTEPVKTATVQSASPQSPPLDKPAPTPAVKPAVEEKSAVPPVQPPAAPVAAATELEKLKLNWKQVLEQAPPEVRRSNALAILRSGVKPAALENGMLSLVFKHGYLKEKIERPENLQVVEKIISSFLGYPCRVRCQLEDNHLLQEALKIGAQITNVEEK